MLGFRSFVAMRYLFVPIKKVTDLTRRWILIVFGLQTLLYLAFMGAVEIGWAKVSLEDPMLLAAMGSTVVLWSLIIGGVLRHSRPALGSLIAGVVLVGFGVLMYEALVHGWFIDHETLEIPKWAIWTMLISLGIGFLLFACSLFFGMLRAYFSFFTTVSIGGVYIGIAALVVVLSVMSGFESDLREKILGSNAHIQVSREDGDFTEWREVKARIDAIPGVVASTPFAVSEVVIAANSNGMNVIIKGIDPKNVGNVTELVRDLEPLGNPMEQIETLKRLEPLISDQHDLRVPVKPAPKKDHLIDPAPADMPSGGDPIDYTTPMDQPDLASPAQGSNTAPEPPPDYTPSDVVDPAPPDLVTTDDPPLDLSKPTTDPVDPTVHVVEIPSDQPMLSRRTQTLPGILVGRELVKQTHLYTGEEVRVVSPLSDPSNPDATGTPIPFNRDYRVAGIFFTGMYEYDLKYVYVTLDSLNEFLDRGDTVDGIEVRVTSPDATQKYVELIKEALGPQYRVQDWNDLNRSLFSALELEKIAMFLVLGIVILVASFSIVGNLIMVVVEKAREIALLKTLGGGDGSVMLIFVIQGLLIGIVGVALGLHTGLIACWFGKRIGIPLNPDVYYIDRMPIHVEPSAVFVIAMAGVLISLIATVYPALVAGQVRPAAGMRH